LTSPVRELIKSSSTKKPQRAQRAQRNINSVISAPSVVDYPSGILFSIDFLKYSKSNFVAHIYATTRHHESSWLGLFLYP